MYEIAKNKNTVMIDPSNKFSENSKLFLDHVHTNQFGSQTIEEEIATTLKILLLEKSP